MTARTCARCARFFLPVNRIAPPARLMGVTGQQKEGITLEDLIARARAGGILRPLQF